MNINNEYEDFLNTKTSDYEIRSPLKDDIIQDLKFFGGQVVVKSLSVHFLVAVLGLLICPQFGIGYFGEHYGLMAWAMSHGEIFCAIVCGAFYLGSSSIALRLSLHRGERAWIKKNSLLFFSAVALTSVAIVLFSLKTKWLEPSHVSFGTSYMLFWVLSGIAATQLFLNQRKLRE